MSSKFFSITKFVKFMNDKYNRPSGVVAYFEASQSFMNKFGKICVKPVMIKVQKLKDVYIKHEDIVKMFDGQLVLTFTENRSRHLPRDKQNLYYLTIDFAQKEYKAPYGAQGEAHGFPYYPTEMFQSMNPKNVEVIRKQEIGARDKRDHTETEHEISPDMI